jgi:anti-sigma regulatory factor (Ser/Thr protein kinase)
MQEAEARFDGEPNSVSAARRFVSAVLEGAGVPDQAWVASQIVSELATNAVLHAGTAFVVRLGVVGQSVRLAVTDERPQVRAAKRQFSADTTTGRGLRLVEQLSQAWGVTSDAQTKTVWCEIVDAAFGDDSADDVSVKLAVDPDGVVVAPAVPLTDASSAAPAPTVRVPVQDRSAPASSRRDHSPRARVRAPNSSKPRRVA